MRAAQNALVSDIRKVGDVRHFLGDVVTLLHVIILTGITFVPFYKVKVAITNMWGHLNAALLTKVLYTPDSQTVSLKKTYGLLDIQLESVANHSLPDRN